MPELTVQEAEKLPALPTQLEGASEGLYVLKHTGEVEISAVDDGMEASIWFKTPPLPKDTIKQIDTVQLFAESHDQGWVDSESAGNWTWFELAILENESARAPRYKDDVELVFKSHRNRCATSDYGWETGKVFEEKHDLLASLEDGNVIAVRICARYPGWSISARTGYLVIDVGEKEVEREPTDYATIISEIKTIHETLHEVNVQTNAAFKPALPDNLLRADKLATGDRRPLRVLSLDGGGVRGLSSLHMLKAVMDKVAPKKLPCEVFDMIAGTSTGGLIAIMLGRLRMSVDDCIKFYNDFMGKIFDPGFFGKEANFVLNGEFYDASNLERIIKDLLKQKIGDPDAKLLDENANPKIFVMAVRQDAANNREPVFLRSYTNPSAASDLPEIKIWEAARATSAAPAYFAPMKVGMYTLIDGGLQANNPLGWLWTEMLALFGAARPTDCFLSLGAGIPANAAVVAPGILGSHDVESGLASAATNTQIMHILFKALINAFAPHPMGKKYWRLNVGQYIPATKDHLDNYGPIGDLDDIKAMVPFMQLTKKYIQTQEQDGTIEAIVKAIMANP